MTSFTHRLVRLPGAAVCLLVLLVLTGCGSGFKTFPPGTILSTSSTSVSVYPLAGDDLAGPCVFDLLLQEPETVQAGTLVVYERGDSQTLYDDKTLQATALALHYSMVWAHECDAASTGAFQADATKGQAEVLFAALTQFATNTTHPELANGGLVVYGFSAAGVLTATLANTAPARLLGLVEYASGDAHVNLETVPVRAAAAAIPTLLLANAEDDKSGTYRSLDYYTRGRAQGALWSYGVQNATDHCCNLSTRDVVVPFVQAVAAAQSSRATAAAALYTGPMYPTFTCSADTTVDAQGDTDCAFSAAAVAASAPAGSHGWLPDQASAAAWLAWVLNPVTN